MGMISLLCKINREIFIFSKIMTHKILLLLVLVTTLISCLQKQDSKTNTNENQQFDYIIAFGSCNNQFLENQMWDPIIENAADVFIWGGDIVYSDTEDMQLMRQNYDLFKSNIRYQEFCSKVEVTGVWDDHDYGINDGGIEHNKKDSVQEIFLDFFNVHQNSPRRIQSGIYNSQEFVIDGNKIKLILLDTRYFRTNLRKDPTGIKRYVPNLDQEASMLGSVQWSWLENELSKSEADFNVIMSSIQFLSSEHGFEAWGNMPFEKEKMESLIKETKAKNVIVLSGDRHIAEISRKQIKGLSYPLVDFTSSGMTHSYDSFTSEPNRHRVSKVVFDQNFGLLKFDFSNNQVVMEIRGVNNILHDKIEQSY